MPNFGNLERFEGGGDDWPCYVDRLEAFFLANDVAPDKRTAVFFSCCGQKTYALLRNLVKPAKPSDKTLAEILQVLGNHFCPKPSAVVQRFRFNTRVRAEGETVSNYVASLKSLSEHCNFGAELENMLRDRIVCGINNSDIQTRLLEQADLTFDNAVQTALAMEAAKKDAVEIAQASSGNVFSTHRVSSGVGGVTCYRCGDGHLATKCKHVKTVCSYCRKRGHLAKVCNSKRKDSQAQSNSPPQPRSFSARRSPSSSNHRRVNIVRDENAAATSSSEVFNMWHVHDAVPPPPFTVTVDVCGKPLLMEVDSGASVSVMAKSRLQQLLPSVPVQPSQVFLRSFSGELKKVQGKADVRVKFQGKEAQLPIFLTGDGSPTLLGRNWMHELGIGISDVEVSIHALSDIKHLVQDYSEVFEDGLGTFRGTKASIHVPSDAPPRFFKPRPLPYALTDGVTQEIQRLQRDSIVVPVKTAKWASPIVPVVKKDGRIRICGDFGVTINPVATVEKYPIPRIEDLWNVLAGGEKFTKLDLRDAYQQVVLDEASREYVTISTHMGLFQYTRLPFGVSSAPAIFQREMENLLRGLPHVAVYFDDILVTGANDAEHLRNLRAVLGKLLESGLKLKLEKCHFFVPQVEYLGHIISKEGLSPNVDKVAAILHAPVPQDVKELQSFLGLVNFYRRFLPNLSSLLRPLHLLLCEGKKWEWGQDQQDAFTACKHLVTSAPVLVHFNPAKPVCLSCDASPYGIGAVLAHKDTEGREHPIAFASRSLSKAEQNYSQLDKEALALVFGVERFHQYLWGIPFQAHTDHKPLLGLLGANKPVPVQASPRVIRWALKLSAYKYELIYKPGKELGHADALSRLPLPNDSPELPRPADIFMLEEAYPRLLSPAVVARATRNDPVLGHVVVRVLKGESLPAGPQWNPFTTRSSELSIHEGCLLWGSRVVIPKSLQAQVLAILHASHPGVEKTKMIARSHVWWPGIDNDISNNVKSCTTCQAQHRAAKPVQQTPWPFPQRPWSRLHIDFGGPFLGHTFLVIVDAFSKWIEVFPVSSTSAEATISSLRTAFAQHGLPDLIVSDNGPAFTSAQYLEFLTRNGIRRMLVPPYHPASNGAAERVVQTVKNKLKKSGSGNFQTQLARFLFQYRTTPHEVTGRPPCELLTGRIFKTPLDVLRPNLQASVLLKQLKQKLYADRGSRQAPSLQPGDDVYARNFRRGTPWVPASVVDTTPSSAHVRFEDGTVANRHSDHLRLVQTGTPSTPVDSASASDPPQLEPLPLQAPAVPDMSCEELPPGNDFPGSSCARDAEVTTNSGACVSSDSAVATASTPKLRRSARTRKPVARYSP